MTGVIACPAPVSERAAHVRKPVEEPAALRGLRVVLCVNSVAMGGVEEHVRQLATGLVERQALVTAVIPSEAIVDPLAHAVEAAGVTLERLNLSRDMRSPSGLRRLVRMVRLLRKLRPDLLHLHLVGFDGGRWVLLAAALAGVPNVLCTIHIAPGERQGLRVRLDRALLGPIVNGYVAVSQASRRLLVQNLGLPAHKVLAIPNAVELRRFAALPPEPARRRMRDAFGIPSDAPVIGSLARLNPQKGLTYLISAMPTILAAHPDTHVLLVGDGPLHDDLLAQARALGVDHRIHFAGYRANTAEFLRAMDLFVLPSLYEGMPLSILEAMGAALPIVATAVDGTPEAVAHGETGLLIPPKDPRALAEAVISLLGNRQRAASMGRRGRARAEAQFSETAMLERIGRVYGEMVRRR